MLSRSASISSVDRVGVGHRVDAPLDMGDVAILEAAQDMGDGVDLADIGEELVAEPLSLRRAAHQPRDVDKSQPRRDGLLRLRDGGQPVEPGVGNRHLADIRLDGAEGKIGRLRGGGARQRVEKRRLADIGQPDDAASETHGPRPLPLSCAMRASCGEATRPCQSARRGAPCSARPARATAAFMSETSPPPSSEGPVFILVRPQMGENIGAAARAMWNFGLDRMRLVAPRDGWPNPKAVATASGAGRVLDWAQVRESVADATADLTTVYASTARPREMTKLVMTPQAAAADMAARIAAGERVGIMMGPERTGLETDDIVRASVIVTVPTNPDFPSINLAQATLLMAWEWRRLQDDTAPAALRIPREGAPAPRAEIDGMLAHLEAELDDAHFFFPEHKRPKMLDNLRGLFFRAELTEADVRTLRGVIRALAEGPKRRR
jgi:tRNA/rRNA methyltransferase